MSQRYEVTPGTGLVARHGDSVLWVSPDASPEVWDSLADLVSHHPGTDPNAADTAASIESILGPLSSVPGLAFVALLVADDQAQGVLYGPVTVRNVNGQAPTHGYGPFGITIPFGLTEPIYVGFTEADSRLAGQGASYLHLDAGVVPGSGMWMHPQTRGERIYQQHGAAPSTSSSSGSHAALTDPTPAQEGALPGDQAAGAALVVDAEQSRPPQIPASASVPALPNFVQDALAGGVTAASGAAAASALAAAGMTATNLGPQGQAIVESPSAPPVDPYAPPEIAEPAQVEQPVVQEATAIFTPDLEPDPEPAQPVDASVAPWLSMDEPPAQSGPANGFVPAADHLRIDLRLPQPGVQALPPLPPVQPVQQAPEQQAPRGGVLVFDDGSTFSLDQDYVIGRKPERHALVQSGQARPLTVVDPDSVLSGAHAAVRLQGPSVFLEDLGSLNGSHIAFPGATEWTRVDAHAPVRLEPGTRLLFGWTVATFSGS